MSKLLRDRRSAARVAGDRATAGQRRAPAAGRACGAGCDHRARGGARRRWRVLLCVAAGLLAALASPAGARGEDQFFALASVQAVRLEGGAMLVKLAASGPIAWQVLPEEGGGGAPVAGRLRVRLFGLDRSEVGAWTATEAGAVTATPDEHGNLDVTLTAAGSLAGRLLRVRQGRTTNEIEILPGPVAVP